MGKILRGLTLGGILGFLAGIFLAPVKGEEARKKLKDSLEKGKEKFQELKEELNQKAE